MDMSRGHHVISGGNCERYVFERDNLIVQNSSSRNEEAQ